MNSLIHHVQVFDQRKGRVEKISISAFCQQCGNRRGTPSRHRMEIFGDQYLVDVWDNPCGHHDHPDAVLDEAESQCALDGCTVLASDTYYPYCSEPCFAQAGREIASHLMLAARQLSNHIAVILSIKEVFERAQMKSSAMDQMVSLIGIAQDVLLDASSMSPEMYPSFWS